MKLLTQSEFARQLHISRQAVGIAIKEKKIDTITQGKRKFINMDSYKTIQYIKADNSHRKHLAKTTPFQEKKKGKQPGKSKKVKTKAEIKEDLDIPADSSLELHENDMIAAVYQKARTREKLEMVIKRKLENAYKRGTLIDREKVYNSVMFFLDRIFRNLELLSGTFLSDIGNEIITAGNVTPAIRKRWVDEILSQIDEAKEKAINRIKTCLLYTSPSPRDRS